MHRLQRRTQMPFDRDARGSHLASYSTGTIAAFMTRDPRAARRCKAARQHARSDPAIRTNDPRHQIRIT